MTRIARLALASVLASALFGGLLAVHDSASAAANYTVRVAPASDMVAVGELAVFRVRVEGQTTALPSFNFDVEGGSLAGVASIDPIAANVAEGAVYVSRQDEGTARLTVRVGGEVLASGQARFARMGKVNLSVTLDAGSEAAARTWRFEVVSPSGQVVASLSANTSGDAQTDVVASPQLPYGFYTVRQVLGNDTRTACGSGAFYRVVAPVSAETTIELAGALAAVNFTIAPCPDLPAGLEVVIPIDTLAPAPGVLGDAGFLPDETPISEVRGAREEGPGNPLPPRVGNTAPARQSTSNLFALLLVTGVVATFVPVAAWSVASVRGSER